MKKLLLTIWMMCAMLALAFGQQQAKTNDGKLILLFDDGSWMYADSVPLYNLKSSVISLLEIPKTKPSDKIIKHTGFALLYNETHEQAEWVAYELTKAETTKLYDRNDKFVIDPKVKTGTANNKDYEGSGYDRGHLAPAADMCWSLATMSESFYYSNICPQAPSFNRGIWKNLESLVRSWAIENDAVYIVTGPVLNKGLKTIGPNKVSVPDYYYKVILDYSEPSIKGIGFIFPNIGSTASLVSYAVTIDSVEKLTGIDFFPLLQDQQEDIIEKTLCLKCWTWKSTKTVSDNTETNPTFSTQCKGLTKANQRCKNKTLDKCGYCYHHISQAGTTFPANNNIEKKATQTTPSKSVSVQCSGTTKAGNRCKRMTTDASGRCYQH
jgi:endonuclease G